MEKIKCPHCGFINTVDVKAILKSNAEAKKFLAKALGINSKEFSQNKIAVNCSKCKKQTWLDYNPIKKW